MGGPGSFNGGFGGSIHAEVSQTRPWSWQRQSQGQGVDPCKQAGPYGQGHEHLVLRGDLTFLPINESEITDIFLETYLKVKVLKIMPVQKQTHSGQRI